ncbi:MAG: CDP-glycerol glycerophosphotransferase family protein [Campylobacterota bacterium]|nr:CDP-glycerol glycerophosphotransferase family protein [Campylobacterota bacterium]
MLKYSCLNIISYFVKKNSNIWVFGAVRGKKYMDNSKYLFEYVNQNTDIEAVWLTSSSEVIDTISKKGYKVFDMNSINGIYYAIHAKIAIITHRGINDNSDLPFHCFSKETKIIQLWHGIALKKIGFDDKIDGFRQNELNLSYKIKQRLKQLILPYKEYVNNPSLLLALSTQSQNIFSKAFRVDKSSVKITGYPRNDILVKNKEKVDSKIQNIIYMPTFRNKSVLEFDITLIDNFLSKKGLMFYIKIHPFDKLSSLALTKIDNSKNIFILEVDDIYEKLSDFDILITDYSSIYFDYLLLNRPIIFAPFDKDTYLKNEREFYYEYEKITPGPHALNWTEVISCIDGFTENQNLYSKEREDIKNRFHKYQDNDSSKRVTNTILGMI